jgi:hypothetical protein
LRDHLNFLELQAKGGGHRRVKVEIVARAAIFMSVAKLPMIALSGVPSVCSNMSWHIGIPTQPYGKRSIIDWFNLIFHRTQHIVGAVIWCWSILANELFPSLAAYFVSILNQYTL